MIEEKIEAADTKKIEKIYLSNLDGEKVAV